MMTTVQENHWSSSDALLQSSAAENREQLLPSSPDNTPLPPSSPISAPPSELTTSDPPAEEYGDDDIDDVLFDDRGHTGNSSGRIRAVSDLLQGKEQKMNLERKKKRTFSLPIKISLYDGPSDSNYNHLDPTHMFAILEEIQTDIWQRWLQLSPALATPTKLEHDDFGYAIPSKNRSTRARDTEVAAATHAREHTYEVVDDVIQEQLCGKNEATGNVSLVPAHSSQSEESVKPDGMETQSPVVVASTVDEGITPYATVDIIAMNVTRQKQKASTDHESAYDEVRQPHTTTIKMECNGTGNSPSVHETPEVDPLYAEVTEPGTIAVTNHPPVATENGKLIEPYATVNIPYKHTTSTDHKITCDAIRTCAPINAALSKLEIDNSNMCNKATALTA